MTSIAAVLLVLLTLGAPGDEPPDSPPVPPDDPLRVYEEIEVRERADDLVGIADSATEGSTGRLDLARRPILRPGELIETTPGVVATQHSGGGKANQFFVRGFNLDHGTDFSVRVAGVPVNMPTHGHGQGYADLSFLIPELVERVRYRKGPYYADAGDFSAAGSIDMAIVRELPERLLAFTGGSYGYGRALWADSFEVDGGGDVVAAVEGFHEDGPWTRDQDYQGWKGLARYSAGDAQRGHSLTFMGYAADWLSTDQIPRRAVDSGLIDRFDLIDPGPRGDTARLSLSAERHRGSDDALTELSGYLLYYDFGLVSNFTYFLDNPEDGDQFEQADRRWVGGLDLRRSWLAAWGDRRVETSAGAGLRYDDVSNGLFRTRDLERTATVRRDDVRQIGGGVWADALVHWNDKVRTRFGLRGDVFSADVASDLAANSGSEDDALLSPKLSLILGPWNSTEVYLNAGYGHHSNDARGAVIAVDPTSGEAATPVDPLVRARGVDVGLRTTLLPGLHTTLTVFALELDSELVFVGDGGATEASRPSRRVGVEWTNFYQATPHVALDLDVTLTDATFTDTADLPPRSPQGDAPEGDEIPGAIGTTIAAGLSFDDVGAFFGALRWRYFGDVPLIEDGSLEWESASLVNARVGYRFASGLELVLDVFNLFDSDDSDIQYFYASRLPGEPIEGVEDVHFHPMESRSARLSIAWRR
ncbi:MAG TPA: TonB-dependent receptor [Thermoanaerobaculia bacterium]